MKQMNCTSLCIFSENWVLTKGCLLYETHSCLVGPWPPNKKLYKENRNQSIIKLIIELIYTNIQRWQKVNEQEKCIDINDYCKYIIALVF